MPLADEYAAYDTVLVLQTILEVTRSGQGRTIIPLD